MTDPAGSLKATRAFAWGIVIVGDSATTDIPELGRGAAFGSSDAAIVVAVRHAQDVAHSHDDEFLVEIACVPGPAGNDDLAFDGHVLVSSGRLSIGDANHEDVLQVSPGRWRVQIATAPRGHAERVTLWLSPAQ